MIIGFVTIDPSILTFLQDNGGSLSFQRGDVALGRKRLYPASDLFRPFGTQLEDDRASVIHLDPPAPVLFLPAPVGSVVEPNFSQVFFKCLVGLSIFEDQDVNDDIDIESAGVGIRFQAKPSSPTLGYRSSLYLKIENLPNSRCCRSHPPTYIPALLSTACADSLGTSKRCQ